LRESPESEHQKKARVSAPCLCDLHVHSVFSDGTLSPDGLLTLAEEKGLRAIGITDHDTLGGIIHLRNRNQCHKVEVVPGIEINTEWKGRELHILGYYVDVDDPNFADALARQRQSRVRRIEAMVEKLKSIGYSIRLDRVLELSEGDSPGRPHVAKALVEKGYIKTVREAFDRFLAIGKPAYVEREHFTPMEAVTLIVEAKGVAVWAHPGTARCISILPDLIEQGLQGLEAFHPEHDIGTSRRFVEIAETHSLIVTGGSDFHGDVTGTHAGLGSITVPYQVVEKLKETAQSKGVAY
jgi:predicted metal-dependent phosphoesterase TrpH